jgi:hypothetical protein
MTTVESNRTTVRVLVPSAQVGAQVWAWTEDEEEGVAGHWVRCAVHAWNGTAWIQGIGVRAWSGSSWIDAV